MKRDIGRTIFFAVLLLLLILPAVSRAQDCSNARVAGDWGHTLTGTIFAPTGAVPFAAVGKITLDADGNFTGTQYSSLGGRVGKEVFKGILTLNPDCTATLAIGVYDEAEHLLRTANWALVFDDSARGLRGIITSLVLPDGTSVPSVVTSDATKLFQNPGGTE